MMRIGQHLMAGDFEQHPQGLLVEPNPFDDIRPNHGVDRFFHVQEVDAGLDQRVSGGPQGMLSLPSPPQSHWVECVFWRPGLESVQSLLGGRWWSCRGRFRQDYRILRVNSVHSG